MTRYYTLDREHHLALPCPDEAAWVAAMVGVDHHVAFSTGERFEVSTVFLGFDHNRRPGGEPLLFETMLFIEGAPRGQTRARTWAEAEAQHAAMCEHASALLIDAAAATSAALAAHQGGSHG